MIKNNKLLETLYKCASSNLSSDTCKGCFYGNNEDRPRCMAQLMNDILFFFGNPVPDPNARVLCLEEVEEILSDKKDHLAFAEFISNIHVARPVIRIVTSSGNFITLSDPQTGEKDSFNKNDYYTSFRIWSAKPSDSLRNATPWEALTYLANTDKQPIKQSNTNVILSYISHMPSDRL